MSPGTGFAKMRAVQPLLIIPIIPHLALYMIQYNTIGKKNYTEVAFTCGIAVISYRGEVEAVVVIGHPLLT